MISYAADSHTLYGALYHFPAANHTAGEMRGIYDWDSGSYLGQIPEANYTYNVVGNANEWGLTIAESTFGGLPQLASQPGAIIDYGSLIYIALQRSKTAREAIQLMANLTNQYGYASEGESFSLADDQEVWVMDFIGKGPNEKGAVWAAVRIPDGSISAHANQARIRTFPQNDPVNCLYAPDVISFARAKGLYPQDASDSDFSFSDVYNPLTFEGARACEARVWSFFIKVNSAMEVYWDYAVGINLTHRMPLYIQPTQPISLTDAIKYMKDRFEGTMLQFDQDVGAGPFNIGIRWRPLDFQVDGNTYINERSVSTQQTGFTFVAQVRPSAPAPLKAVLWFGVDDTALAVHVPVYGGMPRIPSTWSEGSGDMMTFNFQSAFWVFNMVSNFVYTRWNLIYPDVSATIAAREAAIMEQFTPTDAKICATFFTDPQSLLDMATDMCVQFAENVTADWLKLWQNLFVKYMDGNVKTPGPDNNPRQPIMKQPGYGQRWYERIVIETGTHYLEPASNSSSLRAAHTSMRRSGKVKGV